MSIKNKFSISEFSGALGDIGTTLPIAFALIIMNGFPAERIFLLWGGAYIISGYYFKVPVSIQPLKAMAVIAIAKGYSPEMLSSTAIFYGLLLFALSKFNVINWLHQWFSNAIVKGIQIGIGLILAKKALKLVIDKGFLLNLSNSNIYLNVSLLMIVLVLIWYVQFKQKIPIILPLFILSIIGSLYFGLNKGFEEYSGSLISFTKPNISLLFDSLVLLMLPQLPLTLGNAVYAANDSCHVLWKRQSQRVNPKRLGQSIGINNIVIGLLGGFPICHGAGGIGAHAQFGGKTGGTTIIIGLIYITIALINPLATFIFLIPVPILSAMLIFDSLRMVSFIKLIEESEQLLVALVVSSIAFLTRNLFIALICGLFLEYLFKLLRRRKKDD